MAEYPNESQMRVLTALSGAKQAKKVTQIVKAKFSGETGADRSVRNAMRMLVSKGHVSNVSRGKYRITEEGESLLGGDTPDVQPATKQMSLFTE